MFLVSDNPDGPYVPMKDSTYLPADKPTLDGTFWVDKDGKPYMVYCYEWLQALDGTIEKIELKPDLSGTIGEGNCCSVPANRRGAVKKIRMARTNRIKSLTVRICSVQEQVDSV